MSRTVQVCVREEIFCLGEGVKSSRALEETKGDASPVKASPETTNNIIINRFDNDLIPGCN